MPDSLGPAYAEVVRRRLSEEAARRNSLQSRGTAVISTAGVVIGLLFAFEKAVGAPLSTVDVWVRTAAGGAVLAFCLAGLVAIVTVWPTRIPGAVGLTEMKEKMRWYWNETSMVDAEGELSPRQAIALQEVHDLEDWERSNDKAFLCLRTALVAEVVGIVLVGVVVVALLTTPPS